MTTYVLRRLIQAIPIIIGISVISFAIVYLSPGTPFDRFRSNRVPPEVIDKFQRQFPGIDALNDLDHWHAFETANPLTFRHMYIFSVRKDAPH